MIYSRLKRTWIFNECTRDLEFKLKETFPELKKLNREELCDRFCDMNIDFYEAIEVPVKPLIRLTLPFAIITIILMLISLPINFIITGRWGYNVRKQTRLINWFRALKLNV